jgi:putative flippase GtrA
MQAFRNALYRMFISKTDDVKLQLFRSVFVSAASFLFDFVLLYLFTSVLGFYNLFSNIFSYTMGWVLNYILSGLLVFHTRKYKSRSKEVLFTALIVGSGFCMNELLLWILSDGIGIHYLISKAVAGALTFFWNFFLRKYILYHTTH